MVADQTTLVPPGRLGALLSARRRELGCDLADLARASDGEFTPSVLADLEQGRRVLDDGRLNRLADLYEMNAGPVIPARSRLIVDLAGQELRVGNTGVAVEGNEIDQVLERYLSLLYLLRNIEPGRELTLRDPDLAVLSGALERSVAGLEQRLGELMLGTTIDAKTKSLAARLVVPGAGLLVGVTAIGALVMVGGTAADSGRLSTPDVASVNVAAKIVQQVASFGAGGAEADASATERIVLPSGMVAELSQINHPADVVAPDQAVEAAQAEVAASDALVHDDASAPDDEDGVGRRSIREPNAEPQRADAPMPSVAAQADEAAPSGAAAIEAAPTVEAVPTAEPTAVPEVAVVDVAPTVEAAPTAEPTAVPEVAVVEVAPTVEAVPTAEPTAVPEVALAPAVEVTATPEAQDAHADEHAHDHGAIVSNSSALDVSGFIVNSAPDDDLRGLHASEAQLGQDHFALLGAEAEALIAYDFRAKLPGWTFEFVDDTPGYRGLTHLPTKTISIFINDGDTARDVADILGHEVGHALDVTYMNDSTRHEWLAARGMPTVWWPGDGLSDFHVGAGDFAEGVAAYFTGAPSHSAYGAFTAEQLGLIARWLP